MTDPNDDAYWPNMAAQVADAKSGDDVLVLDVGPVLALCSHFVISSASNTRLVRTLADSIEQEIRAAGGPSPIRVEGLDDARWVLVDYGDFVVHLFLDETRRYYDLERLWADVDRVDWRAAVPAK